MEGECEGPECLKVHSLTLLEILSRVTQKYRLSAMFLWKKKKTFSLLSQMCGLTRVSCSDQLQPLTACLLQEFILAMMTKIR